MLSTLMPQQLQIVKTLDRPLFVSAGAGSGQDLYPHAPHRLRARPNPVRSLSIWTRCSPLPLPKMPRPRSATIRRALIEEGMDEEALTVDDAWISTIHGMCSRILRARAGAGHRSEFTVLTDTDELMDRAVEHVLGRATAPDAAPRARRFS